MFEPPPPPETPPKKPTKNTVIDIWSVQLALPLHVRLLNSVMLSNKRYVVARAEIPENEERGALRGKLVVY